MKKKHQDENNSLKSKKKTTKSELSILMKRVNSAVSGTRSKISYHFLGMLIYGFKKGRILLDKAINPLWSSIHNFIDNYRSVLNLLVLFLFFPIVVFCSYMVFLQHYKDTSEISNIGFSSMVVIIFLFYLFRLVKLLRDGRRYGNKENLDIKYVYIIFATFYCFMVVISLVDSSVNEMFDIKKWLSESILYPDLVIRLSWGAANSLKESILAAIIFDSAFQMFNFNLNKEQEKYLNELVHEGKLYMLPEERQSQYPTIWYIRGDACADLVDDLNKYKFKRSYKYKIKYSDEQRLQIVLDRKRRELDDRNCCYYDEEPGRFQYFFYFTLIDFKYCSEYGLTKDEIYNTIRDKIIEFPEGVQLNKHSIDLIVEKLSSYREGYNLKRFSS